MNTWNIDCKFAKDEAESKEIAFGDITKCLDDAFVENCASVYIELTSKAIKKEPKITQSESIENKQ